MASWQFAGQFLDALLTTPIALLPSQSVTVKKLDATNATLYTTRLKAATATNPATTDSSGNLSFFADPGQYNLSITIGGTTTTTLVTVPVDPSEDVTNVYNVCRYAAVGDGTTDDYAAIQAVLTAAPAGSRVLFPAGKTFKISAGLSWSNKALHIEGHGATLVEATALAPMLLGTTVDGSTISGLTLQGVETIGSFGTPGSGTDKAGLKLITSLACRVQDITVTGKSRGIYLLTCTRCRVTGSNVTGFATTWSVGTNYHNGVLIRGSFDNYVGDTVARNIGSAVLVELTTTNLDINGVSGIDCYDNGVYISSGWECTVRGANIRMTTPGTQNGGSAVKCRGSDNTVVACTADGTDSGFTLTGSGNVADAYGANGIGSKVIGCTGTNLRYNGVTIDTDGTLYPRHFSVTGNVIHTVGTAGGATAGVLVNGGNHHIVSNNIIVDAGIVGSTLGGIFMAGVTGTHAVGHVVEGNIIINTVHSGMLFNFVNGAVIRGNRISVSGRDGIEHNDGLGGMIEGNDCATGITSNAVRVVTSTNVIVKGNRGTTFSIAAGNISNENGTNANGQRLAEAGTAGAPSYSILGDEDTGMYQVGANDLGFAVGGANVMRIIANAVKLNEAANIDIGTTTGSKIGLGTSAKIGFWNATPIIQPTTAVAAATFAANTSGITNDTATFDGYTIGQVVKALRNEGLLA